MSRGSELKTVRNGDSQLTAVTLLIQIIHVGLFLSFVHFNSNLFFTFFYFKKIYHSELGDKDN